MIDSKYIEEQVKELARESREYSRLPKWTMFYEFFYKAFTGAQIDQYTNTVVTRQSVEEKLSNLEKNLDVEDFEILKKETVDEGVVVYLKTLPHLSPDGYGVLVAAEIKNQHVKVTTYEQNVPFKSIDTYRLMDVISQTIVVSSKRAGKQSVSKAFINEEVQKEATEVIS